MLCQFLTQIVHPETLSHIIVMSCPSQCRWGIKYLQSNASLRLPAFNSSNITTHYSTNYNAMPYVKTTAIAATNDMATGLPLNADPALLGVSVAVALPEEAAAALTGAYAIPSVVLHSSPARALALSRNVMSAHWNQDCQQPVDTTRRIKGQENSRCTTPRPNRPP